MKTLEIKGEKLLLARCSSRNDDPLQAWDAADELLHTWLTDQSIEHTSTKVCIVNDSFGALTVLQKKQGENNNFFMVSDSLLAQRACHENLIRNDIAVDSLEYLHTNSLSEAFENDAVPFDQLLFKVPKSLSQLEQQLHLLRPMISPDTLIVGAGMVKRIHRSTLALIETIIGPTTTSLATKKARLIHTKKDDYRQVPNNPYPKYFPLPSELTKTDTEAKIFGHGGVFSSSDLDIGTRLLLELMPGTQGETKVIDLGCGTGAIGVVTALRNVQAKVTFVDESFAAIESAKASVNNSLLQSQAEGMSFVTTNCLEGIADSSSDLILSNPPFHDQGSRDLDTSLRMFRDAHRVLKIGGKLRIVGNRHLNYHSKLKKIFGNVSVLGSNAKFVVLETTR